jgi:hypothetical protein
MVARREALTVERPWLSTEAAHTRINWMGWQGNYPTAGMTGPCHPSSPSQYMSWSVGESSAETGAVLIPLSTLRTTVEHIVTLNLDARLAEYQRRSDLLYDVMGLHGITPDRVDDLAEEAYIQMERDGHLDPITFAERTGIDVRLADLVFRRLKSQGSIAEA